MHGTYLSPMMQRKWTTPDEVFLHLPEDQRLTAFVLRDLIFETCPEATEKLSWGAPFYYGKKSFAFIWPAAVPWGKITEGVALGFTREGISRTVYLRPEDIDPAAVQDRLRHHWNLAL